MEAFDACPQRIRDALTGPCPSIRTPFARDGAIDYDGLRAEIDFVLNAGATSVILTHGDSLYSALTDDEVADVTKAVVEHVARRAMVVAADRIWWTGKEAEFAAWCAEVGVDMLMVLPPDWAASTTVETLVAHYAAAAEHIPVMMVTNYLARRPLPFALKLIEALRDRVPGVVALKDDVGGEFIRKACLLTHDRWALIAGGQKQNHMNMLPYGVDGYLSTFMLFQPDVSWQYWQAIEAGDLAAASDVIRDYDMPFFEFILGMEGSFDAALHGILEIGGIAGRWRRPPYHSLTDEQMQTLAAFLKGKGLI